MDAMLTSYSNSFVYEKSQSHLYIAFASWCVFLQIRNAFLICYTTFALYMRETQVLCRLAQDRHWLLILESTRASGLCCPEILLWVRPLSFFSPNRQWIP